MSGRQAQLEELLVDWGLQRQQGNELTAEELCIDNSELVSELSRLISELKEMDWLEEDDDLHDDFLQLPDFSTLSDQADEARLPECLMSLNEFCQRLIESGLMDQEQVEQLRKLFGGHRARAFAQQLISEKKLTNFQATVLLECQDVPLVLDRYVILGEIGKGGMGTVYKALHQQMDRIVALKILPKAAVDSPDKVRRFHREVKAVAKLEHPNIVTAFDAREDKEYHFLVMSLVNGSDLSQLIRQKGPLPVFSAIDYVIQAARGLEHAHSMGIIHRDIKPANLLLNQDGKVKILDMGLARIDAGDPEQGNTVSMELTQAGAVMGTIAYLAPEQALDTRHADARSDIYALGCTLYFLLTGKPPYIEDTMMKTVMAHREGAIPSLREERKDVPQKLESVFETMLAKKPEHRFQSMSELISALEMIEIEESGWSQTVIDHDLSFQETRSVQDEDTSRATTFPKPVSVPPRKNNWGIIAVCLFGLAGMGWAWASGIFLKVETEAGTIILEVDQPELAGAEVTVDGEKKITLKTGEGKEPIQIEGDEKTHLIKVTKGGFETFTKAFTVKAGKSQTIRVYLEPLRQQDSHSNVTIPESQAVVSEKASTYALSFDGVNDFIEIPNLKIDAAAPLTFEAWCTISPAKAPQNEFFDPLFTSNTLTDQEAGYALIFARDNSSFWMANQKLVRHQASSNQLYVVNVPPGQRYHIAAVWDKESKRLYIDGKLVAQGANPMDSFKTDFDDSKQFPVIGKASLLHLPLQRYLKGKIDEIRISNIARYTADYSPADRIETDEHTQALYHFDDGSGTDILDSSGNGHHGVIHGATWTPHSASAADIENQSRNYSVAEWVLSIGGWIATPHSKIEDKQSLKKGGSLLSVMLQDNEKVSDKDLVRLTPLENLIVLNLANTNVSDAGMQHIGKIRTLERLDLQNSAVTGKGLRYLASLQSLKTLWANGLTVSNSDIEALTECTGLEQLSLNDPAITDAAIEYLSEMKSLQSLNLTGTSVSEGGKADLRANIPHCQIK